MVSTMEPRWPAMASAARQTWNEWFSDNVLFDRIGDALADIQKGRKISESVAQRVPSIPAWHWRTRRAFQFVRSHWSPNGKPHHLASPKVDPTL